MGTDFEVGSRWSAVQTGEGGADFRRPFNAYDMNREVLAVMCCLRVNHRHRKGFLDCVTIPTRRHEAHLLAVLPLRPLPGFVCSIAINLQRDDPFSRPVSITFRDRAGVLDEVFAPHDPTIPSRLCGCLSLGEFRRPNAEEFLQTDRDECVEPKLFYVLGLARFQQHLAQSNMVAKVAVEIKSALFGDAHPRDIGLQAGSHPSTYSP